MPAVRAVLGSRYGAILMTDLIYVSQLRARPRRHESGETHCPRSLLRGDRRPPGFFLSQVDKRVRSRIKTNIGNLVRLLGYFRIPIVITLERPVDHKGSLPKEIRKQLGDRARNFEKDFYDLCKEKDIRDHLRRLKRRQMIVAGCETDVCVLQSCLGLLSLGYEVFVMEELIFSSSRDVDAAITRMKAEGVTFMTYKSLF